MHRLFYAILLFSSSLWGGQKENVRSFVEALPKEHKTILEDFLQTLVKDSLSGYVLFGDKPMCIEACPLTLDSDVLHGIDEKSSLLFKGFKLWQAFNVSQEGKEYSFLIFDSEHACQHLICINRQAFLKVVNENLSLFRYALGPTITAEGLLKELIEAKDQFYHVLKDDNVLLGILLGYGTQNALLVSRKELIADAFASDRIEEFPFLPKSQRKSRKTPLKAQSKKPSLGFPSIDDENQAIKELTTVSRKLKPFDSYEIPYFGCDPNSPESKVLLATYEKNRSNIIKAVESRDFLEKTLLKLLTNRSGKLEIPNLPETPLSPVPTDKDETVKHLVKVIHLEMAEEKRFKDCFSRALLLGIRDRENDVQRATSRRELSKRLWEIHRTEKDLERAENLEKTEAFFQQLSTEKKIACLVPRKLYFKVLQQGTDAPATPKMKNVTLHYSFNALEEQKTNAGTVKSESIEQFVPGIAQALIGMKKGEVRNLYIHPEYGYGDNSYLPPNLPVIAKIELVDFEEGEHEATLPVPHILEKKNHKELSAKYEELQNEQFYSTGIDFWDSVKKTYSFIDFATFESYFHQHQDPGLLDTTLSNKFLSDLEYQALSLQSER